MIRVIIPYHLRNLARTGAEIQLESAGEAPLVKWDPVTDAASYDVTVRNQKKILMEMSVKEPQARLFSLKQGTFWWTVRPVDPLGRKGAPILTREISLRYGPVLPAPELVRSKVD